GDDDFGGGFGEIAEGDEIGAERGIGPGEEVEFLGLGRNLGGIKTGRNELDDAGVRKIIANDLGEKSGVGIRAIGAMGERKKLRRIRKETNRAVFFGDNGASRGVRAEGIL